MSLWKFRSGGWFLVTSNCNQLFVCSLSTYIVFICVFCCSLKFDFSFKMSISKCCSVWSVALSTVGFCTAWMRQNQILVLPNRDLGFGMTTFLTSVVFNETKNWGGGKNMAEDRKLALECCQKLAKSAQRQIWSSDDEAEIDEVGWFTFS